MIKLFYLSVGCVLVRSFQCLEMKSITTTTTVTAKTWNQFDQFHRCVYRVTDIVRVFFFLILFLFFWLENIQEMWQYVEMTASTFNKLEHTTSHRIIFISIQLCQMHTNTNTNYSKHRETMWNKTRNFTLFLFLSSFFLAFQCIKKHANRSIDTF